MSREIVAAAEVAIRAGSKSFAAASRLFDRRTREGAVMLYAWCRHADDAIDGQVMGFRADETVGTPAERLAHLEARTRAALAGAPDPDPVFAGLAEVARRHAIPARYPLQHLDGFRMDVAGRRYETLADTLDYAYHVAGVVGVMMAHVMGVRDPAILDRASDLGLAFQLTNIARDIVEDFHAGRVYLPEIWLREVGMEPADIADPGRREALARAAARLVAAAEPYYASARLGIAVLPPRCAWAIATALGIYREIGVEVVRRGPRAWDRRVSTSRVAKLRHAAAGASVALTARRRAESREDGPREALYVRPR